MSGVRGTIRIFQSISVAVSSVFHYSVSSTSLREEIPRLLSSNTNETTSTPHVTDHEGTYMAFDDPNFAINVIAVTICVISAALANGLTQGI